MVLPSVINEILIMHIIRLTFKSLLQYLIITSYFSPFSPFFCFVFEKEIDLFINEEKCTSETDTTNYKEWTERNRK